jgi:hypothetical protein
LPVVDVTLVPGVVAQDALGGRGETDGSCRGWLCGEREKLEAAEADQDKRTDRPDSGPGA